MKTRRGWMIAAGLTAATVAVVGCAEKTAPPAEPATPRPATVERAEGQTEAPAEPGVRLPGPEAFDRTRAYVATIGDGSVTAVDLTDNTVAWSIGVSEGAAERGPESAMGIAASQDGRYVYTGDAATDEFVVVDTRTREVTRRIGLDHGVHAIDICPMSHIVWVAGQHPDYPWLSKATLIDVKKMEVLRTVSPGLGNAAHLAFTPDADEVWAASVTTNQVWVSDAHTGQVRDVIALGQAAAGEAAPEAKMGLMGFNEIAIDPTGERAYVVGPAVGTIYAIDIDSREVVGEANVGERTHGVAVTRDGREVWTANNAGTVTIADADTLAVRDTIAVEGAGDMPFAHVAFSVDGETAYLAWSKHLTVIDVASREITAEIPTPDSPHELTLEDYYVRPPAEPVVEPGVGGSPQPSGGEAETKAPTRRSQAAGIEVTMTPQTRGPWPAGQPIVLDVALNTHAGDLMTYEVAEKVRVEADGAEVAPKASWKGGSESSHHRTGELRLTLDRPVDEELVVELVDLGVASRTFTWAVE